MKKLLALALALMMVFALAACGGKTDPATSGNDGPGTSQQTEPPSTTPDNSNPSGEAKTPAEIAEELAGGFGTYNSKPIVWQVLSVDDVNKKALLITKDCLDLVRFNEEYTEELSWESSTLRAWLGGEFFDTAFTDEQKSKILEVSNPADTNSESGAQGGNDTTDKVFVLSATEMTEFFTDDEAMIAYFNGEQAAYWTRTPGNDTSGYVCNYSGGGLYMTGNMADSETVAVRPAIWVNLSDTTATAQGVTVTIDKSNYQPGEKIYFAWSGVTDAHAAGVLWGAIRMCNAGSEYDDWIDDKMIDCESAALDTEGLNYFTAPATAGAYEIRFYWYEQDVGYEKNFVLSVPFIVE